eukprot:Tbor_TRINITY_DN6152_c3_g8::TRINITY_DN6152_c3_g8_i1::g.21453::m.21453
MLDNTVNLERKHGNLNRIVMPQNRVPVATGGQMLSKTVPPNWADRLRAQQLETYDNNQMTPGGNEKHDTCPMKQTHLKPTPSHRRKIVGWHKRLAPATRGTRGNLRPEALNLEAWNIMLRDTI